MKPAPLVLVVWVMMAPGCMVDRSKVAPFTRSSPDAVAELTNREFLFAVLGYLYQWHLDSTIWEAVTQAQKVEVRVRRIRVETDDGDRSLFAELWLPQARLVVELQQADHEVPERKLVLKDNGFKVRVVHWIDPQSEPAAAWTVVRLPRHEVIDHLQSYQQKTFLDAAIEGRLRKALADYLHRVDERKLMAGEQVFYAAPTSLVSNELWVYWENQKTAMRFAAEGDPGNPRVWEQSALHVRLVSLDERVTLSANELSGGATSVPRIWAGRFLYNCVVLGKKLTLPAPGQ